MKIERLVPIALMAMSASSAVASRIPTSVLPDQDWFGMDLRHVPVTRAEREVYTARIDTTVDHGANLGPGALPHLPHDCDAAILRPIGPWSPVFYVRQKGSHGPMLLLNHFAKTRGEAEAVYRTASDKIARRFGTALRAKRDPSGAWGTTLRFSRPASRGAIASDQLKSVDLRVTGKNVLLAIALTRR